MRNTPGNLNFFPFSATLLHPPLTLRNRFVTQFVDDNRTTPQVERFPLRPWQSNLYEKLVLPPNNREITFVVDASGNNGKTWFARYYTELHPNSQIIIPGKKADMAYVAREDARVFFFDYPRSKQNDFIQYDFLEELKNGYFFSPKYESKIKILEVPHVVVLMNECPDESKLSSDRYNIIMLN